MKKKDPRNIYDLALSDISEIKIAIEPTCPGFIYFREEEQQQKRKVVNKTGTPMNQTWTLPERSYSWFPYFMMQLTTK